MQTKHIAIIPASTKPFRQISIGRDNAIALANTNWWKGIGEKDFFKAQLFIAEMCCNFGDFHDAASVALNAPIFTHDFINLQFLAQLLLGKDYREPTIEEIIGLIPANKIAEAEIDLLFAAKWQNELVF